MTVIIAYSVLILLVSERKKGMDVIDIKNSPIFGDTKATIGFNKVQSWGC